MEKLYDYLREFLTPERQVLFDRMVEERTKHIAVVVEDIYQPHNASAVLRSCDCFGVQDVHVIENRNIYELNKRVSMGSNKWLTMHYHNQETNNTAACLKELKSKGYKIIATTPHENSSMIQDLDISEPIALVFGTEMEGVSEEVRQHADGFVKIPMYGFTESFNISVAAAISLYELCHRLRLEVDNWKLTEDEKKAVKLGWAKKSIKNCEMIIKRFESENE
jgi:tRNA (guanosine-2'-O-)-methyltransferase